MLRLLATAVSALLTIQALTVIADARATERTASPTLSAPVPEPSDAFRPSSEARELVAAVKLEASRQVPAVAATTLRVSGRQQPARVGNRRGPRPVSTCGRRPLHRVADDPPDSTD